MSQRTARRLLFGMAVFWLSLFVLSPLTREYAQLSFSGDDSAYRFYEDFIIQPQKSLLVFKSAALAVLLLLFKNSRENGCTFPTHFLYGLYSFSAICILFWWPSALGVFALLLLLGYPWKAKELPPEKQRWTLFSLLAVSLLLRLEKLPNVCAAPLQSDSEQYLRLSQGLTWLYDTQHREPLLAWIDRLLTFFFPVPDTLAVTGYLPIRIFTILLSCAVSVMVYRIGSRFFSHQTAFIAALAAAVNKAIIYRSLQGLREELLIISILSVAGLALTASQKPGTFRRGISWGLASGCLLLVRTACLPYVLFACTWAWWRGHRAWKECVISTLVCFLLAAPYYIYCKIEFGDPMYSGNYHVNKFYYMTIFNTGSPDTSKVPYVSPTQLMFHIYPWYKTAALTLEGIADTLVGRFAFRLFYLPFSAFFIACSAVGYVRWLFDPKKRGWLVMMLLLLGPMAFILAMLNHSPVVFDWRTVLHLFPFMAYAASDGFFYLLERARFISE